MRNREKIILFFIGIIFLWGGVAQILKMRKFESGKIYSEKEVIEAEKKNKQDVVNREEAVEVALNGIEIALGEKLDRSQLRESINLTEIDRKFVWMIELKNKKNDVYFIDVNAETGGIRAIDTTMNLSSDKKYKEIPQKEFKTWIDATKDVVDKIINLAKIELKIEDEIISMSNCGDQGINITFNNGTIRGNILVNKDLKTISYFSIFSTHDVYKS